MSWGKDAIQFLPLVPAFANEQIKGLLQGAGWQEARQSFSTGKLPGRGGGNGWSRDHFALPGSAMSWW